ncbi:SIMPL domain-containing protein [Pelagibacterium flavum]|uniref:SIMPL domain-containing protein n=1 Tax=Pelagibacterium flavum TaxID=2984530 RepID=A0ABY6ISL4_9HYPH|nr:SIMPL domain-containing protein [Pelagibacterium sp. YIM 151497]UYQ73394.1 SIMPL domain-containing protein [Pelagibacterium sp. YIM 151497]|tara:strand:- start:2151 stop:2870 length:720 start_codon:yes stop_codon:yes gene_type:complete
MRIPLTLAPIAMAALIASPALADTMTLSGTGTVRAAPDMATINTGVTTQAETAREALDANSAAMADLVAALREAGLEGRDIQTSDFSVSPQYVYSDRRDDNGYSLPPEIQGYQVSNTVTIVVRDLEALGSVLDQAVTVGANTINGIVFAVDDVTKLEEEARKLAFADALAKAETYAGAAGLRLGSIESIQEVDMQQPPMPMYRAQAMEMAADASVPVEAGEMSYSITATIAWEIEDDRD